MIRTRRLRYASLVAPLLASIWIGCGGGGSSSSTPEGGSRGTGGPDSSAPDSSGDGATAPDARSGGTTPEGGDAAKSGGPSLSPPSQSVVTDAIGTALSSYHRNSSTGDIWCTPCDGAPVVLAEASYAGDTSTDAQLLAQMRELLKPGNDPFATGGYSANDERNATAMYAIAKRTPRVWSQLSTTEVHQIDLIMEATFVADVYATADATNTSGAPKTFDGSSNSNRDWNANYQEGMVGAVIVGAEYFGGQTSAEAMLAAYDHAAFTAGLQTNGLQNAYWTFSTYQTNPSAGAPTPATVQQGIQSYSMHGMTLGQLLDIYLYVAGNTFNGTVSCGLDGGAGILVNGVYAGRIVSGCSGLPNAGAMGQEEEFNSSDAMGARSDASYVRLGLRDDLFNQLVLVVYGDWQNTSASTSALQRLKVGVPDFFYKATQGYEDYSHGTDEGLFTCGMSMDCPLNESLWTDVLAPAHGL